MYQVFDCYLNQYIGFASLATARAYCKGVVRWDAEWGIMANGKVGYIVRCTD